MQTCKSCSARIAQGMYCTDCERQMLNKTIDMNALGKMIYERLRPSSACNQQWNMWPDHWQKEYIEAASEITAHVRAERDRLAAENAELKVEISETLVGCNRVAQSLMTELTAANATLDALREAVPIDVTGWTTDEVVAAFFKTQHKLYPQPPETTDDEQ